MKIIIVGAGKVGYYIAKHLSHENNDIVVIDTNLEVLQKLGNELDVMCLKGSGKSTRVLLDAGVKEADVIIAATVADEINMLCCLTGKRLGAKHAIARIRDPEYSYEMTMLQKEMGIDLVINPEYEAAHEIARLLRFPTAANIETFVNERVEMVAFRITERDSFAGESIMKFMLKAKKSIVFCAILRKGEIIIPNGNTVLEKDDLAYIIGEPLEVYSFFKYIGKLSVKIKDAMVIGGGKVSYYLCSVLEKSDIKLKVIERDYKRCEYLNESLPNTLIIHGDGSDEEILADENMPDFGAVITVTGSDEENFLIGLSALKSGVPKVITKINRTNYENIIKSMGIDSVISPKNITGSKIIRFVRALKNTLGNNVETLYKIVDGKAEALEFIASKNTKNLGVPFRDINFKENFIVAAIERKGKVIIPTGNDFISQNDRVIIVSKDALVNDLNDVFADGGR